MARMPSDSGRLMGARFSGSGAARSTDHGTAPSMGPAEAALALLMGLSERMGAR